jgi:FkbM family methyltransferase
MDLRPASILQRVTGNYFTQRVLGRGVRILQELMGIGIGSDVTTSAESAVFRLLTTRYTPPYCVFDVGANRGQFVELMLTLIPADDLSIHCFEPSRASFSLLTTATQHVNATLNNFGLGKTPGHYTLFSDRPASGLASLSKRDLRHLGIDFSVEETVLLSTVDAYRAEHQIGRIHLLKLDIEGHELEALAGAAEAFAAGAVDIVLFEVGGTGIDARVFFRDYWEFFTPKGMTIFRITPSGYLFPIRAYREIDEQFRTTNFVAVRT